MDFPFPETREGQQLLVRDLDDAAAAGLHMLCAAPTGTGKTVAALYPMLLRALAERRKLFFVTAKVSQQALALETLERMIKPGSGICAVQIAAKERVCPQDRIRCRPFRCRYQQRFKTRLEESGLVEELAAEGVVRGETVAERALARSLCPFETTLALAERASAVVADFNYVFDPVVYLRRFFDEGVGEHLLIVDEAHNLPPRAVEYYSPELNLPTLRRVAAGCRPGGGVWGAVADLLDAVADHCEDELARLEEERGPSQAWVEHPDREAFAGFGLRAAEAMADRASAGADPPPGLFEGRGTSRDPLNELLVSLAHFGRCASHDPDLFATLWTREQVRMRCLDPAQFLRECYRGFRASVSMSATLTPLDFFARALGVDGPETVALELGSPFPRRNRRFLAVTSVDTTYKRRSDYSERIAEIMDASVRERQGNYLAFFPSFAYRDEVIAKLRRLSGGRYEILLQLPGVPADALLRRLREPHGGTRLLCGVQGGVFSEGVDYPGDMAIGVFVVAPGLPTVSLEQELVREYYDRVAGAGFEHAYLLPGLARAVQAGGRAIRTPDDRAFVMLLCRRFAEPAYRDALPRYWREELIETVDPVPHLRRFWQDES